MLAQETIILPSESWTNGVAQIWEVLFGVWFLQGLGSPHLASWVLLCLLPEVDTGVYGKVFHLPLLILSLPLLETVVCRARDF